MQDKRRQIEIKAGDLEAQAAYRLLVGAVVPRPIAWVTTLSPDDRVNAAPFSAFTFVCYSPPMVAISVGRKGGELKDTSRYISARREFVVNIADETLVEALHKSSAEFPDDVSEIDVLGLEVLPSSEIVVPRIAAAPVTMECRLHQIIEFGTLRTQLIVGEIAVFHVREDMYADGKIDPEKLRPLGRLAGPRYVKMGEIIRSEPIPASFG